MLRKLSVLFVLLSVGVVGAIAQSTQLRTAIAGQKYKIKGVIVQK